MNVTEEREERERLLKELEKKHEPMQSREEFMKYINKQNKDFNPPARKKKSKKLKVKRCKCK